MAKLNESKKNERTLQSSLDEAEQKCMEADKLAKSAEALQNTVDQLESRLEVANSEKLDAEEQLLNLQAEKSPFHLQFSRCPSALDRGNYQVSRDHLGGLAFLNRLSDS
jgi:predicted  nucleic acid-binding Zn-ribbon protein